MRLGQAVEIGYYVFFASLKGFHKEKSGMSTVQEIEQAISSLSERELARLREWFEEYDAKVWDKQFEQAAQSGKLDERANQAIADFRAGKYKEL
jgi:hypothetical protein